MATPALEQRAVVALEEIAERLKKIEDVLYLVVGRDDRGKYFVRVHAIDPVHAE